jgi:hypothetical protein
VVEDLQQIADDLAQVIGRGVAIDDRHLRLLVHSAHGDDADPIRRQSILTRGIPQEMADWAFSHGIASADGPVRVPAAPELGSDARMVFPLRSQDLLLGFLIIIDGEGTLTEPQIEACAQAASEAAALRYRQRLLHDAEREREHQLVRALLFEDGEARREAATRLAAEGLLTGERAAAVVVGWPAAEDDVDVPIRRALDKARRTLPAGSMVEFTRPGQAVVLVDTARLPVDGVRGFASRLLDMARETTAGAQLTFAGAFGAEVAVETAHSSYDQAVRALQAAERFPGLPDPVGWSDLGVNRLLTLFPLREETIAEIPAGCRELFRHPELLHTVERYLDLACDVKRTASELSLHRASLYTRLQKVERITGLSFKRGEDRLALHLGIRLLRLAGDRPATDAS